MKMLMSRTKFCKELLIKTLIMQYKTLKAILLFKNKYKQSKVKSRELQMLQRLNKISGKLTISRRDSLMEISSSLWTLLSREEGHYMEQQE
jgi:hypothetical protein